MKTTQLSNNNQILQWRENDSQDIGKCGAKALSLTERLQVAPVLKLCMSNASLRKKEIKTNFLDKNKIALM